MIFVSSKAVGKMVPVTDSNRNTMTAMLKAAIKPKRAPRKTVKK